MNQFEPEMRKKTEAELNVLIRQWSPGSQLHNAAETELSRRRILARQGTRIALYIAAGSFILAALIYWIKNNK
jgi:hypothetical protein